MSSDTNKQSLLHAETLSSEDSWTTIGSHRNARISPLISGSIALFITIITYGVFRFFPENRVVQSFTERGPTPIAVVFLFYWSWVILSWKKRLLIKELSTLKLEIIPPATEFRITVLNVQGIIDNIYRISENPSKHTLLNRIHLALFNLQNLGQISEVSTMLESQSYADESRLETSYSLLKGFVWAMPVLGFIGTVMGLSEAVSGFGSVLNDSSELAEITDSLTSVTSGLGTAFETTLLALVAAILVQMRITFLRSAEEQFLDDCRNYCMRNVVRRLRLK